ncbi:HNH endonuclease [Paenibacillus sp. HJGM_3]|uniref:HNH endonuclease n=1 Tax=Paenibacillus sp. HJGM_3 TaxID=3379816 RepID=UPI00386CAAB0
MMTPHTEVQEPIAATKICVQCQTAKPVTEFLRRSRSKSGVPRRRGTCRACRHLNGGREVLPDGPVESQAIVPADVRASASGGGPADVQVGRPADTQAGGPTMPSAEVVAHELALVHPEPGAAPLTPAEGKPKRRRRRRKKAKAQHAARGDAALVAAPGEAGASGQEPAAESASAKGAAAPAKPRAPGQAPAAARAPAPARAPTHAKPHVPAKAPSPAPIKQTPAHPRTHPLDPSSLRPTRSGIIRMRGKTDNGRRWYQEIDPELAYTLVRERAAVVVNRQTIQRLYSNKEFRRLILNRDNYTCHFCGQYGDTIDHLLPRAKGGHTTPVNCVCACNFCNQSKADRDLEEFMSGLE